MKASELRELLKSKNLNGKSAARLLGISERMMRYYTSETDSKTIPKKIELALRSL